MRKRKLIKPTAAEDRAATRAIATDPDTMELTEDVAAQLRPASSKMLELHRRGRGKQKAPTKIATSMRISEDVLAVFKTHTDKATTSMDEVLRDFAVSAGWIEKSDSRATRFSMALAQRGALARKARSGVNPFTGEKVTTKAPPKRKAAAKKNQRPRRRLRSG